MKIMTKKTRGGFTLVEMLLYTVVLGLCLFSMSSFIDMINAAKVKNHITLSIERQGNVITEVIKTSLASASGINYPTSGTSGNSLSLSFADSAKNPTIFSLTNGTITIKEGSSAAVALNDPYITADSLYFENIGRSGTPGSVNTSFWLRTTEANRAEFSYERFFRLGTSRRF